MLCTLLSYDLTISYKFYRYYSEVILNIVVLKYHDVPNQHLPANDLLP